MGPFALADMVGIDIQHSVMESISAQFYGEPAFAPMNLSALRVAGGLLGRKTGAGWFTYDNGQAVDAAAAAGAARRGRSRCGCGRASTTPSCRRRSSISSSRPAPTLETRPSRAPTR